MVFKSCGLLRVVRSDGLLGFDAPTVALLVVVLVDGVLGFATPPVFGVMPPVVGVV